MRRRRWVALALAVGLALVGSPALAGAGPLSWTGAGHLDLVRVPRSGAPYGLLRGEPEAPLALVPLFRVTIRDGRLVGEPAGGLPPRTLAEELLLPGGEGARPVLLVSVPGSIGLLPPAADGTFHPGDLRALVEDPRLAARRLLRADLDGDGQRDLVVESWAGALLVRNPGRPGQEIAGWLPLPRIAAVAPGEVEVRARWLVPPAGSRTVRRLWARDRYEGRTVLYRGTPLDEARPTPPAEDPPLLARLRLPGEPGGGGIARLLPGTPDRVVRVDVDTGWLGPRGRPTLLVLPLVPRETGLPATPELSVPLPLDPREQGPRLVLADVTGDGTDDVLVAGVPRGASRSIAVVAFPATGNGRFATEPLVFRARLGRNARLLALRDLDGDGHLDVLAAARGTVGFWRGDPSREGTLPWEREPTRRWRVPGPGTLPGPVRVITAPGGRWLLLRHRVADGKRTRVLAFPLS